MNPERAQEIVRTFSQQRVVVFGDLMLDRYIWGQASRISQEATVPIVAVNRQTAAPGGCWESGLERTELAEWVRCAVACLPARRGEVFSLRYFAELTYDQIAELLGLEAATVGVTLREARRQLRGWVSTRSTQDLSKGASS